MSGFKSPNYTQIPNDLFDLMPEMGDAELRVVLALCRETFGYHRANKRISVRELARLTGLTPRNAVAGADRAITKGLITKETDGGVTNWGVVVEDTPYPIGVRIVSPRGTPSKKERNKETDTSSPPPCTTKNITDAYQGVVPYPVDWSAGEGRAAKWLAKAGYSGQQVADCYRHLKAQPFWKDKPLSLASLKKQIGEYVKLHPSAATAADGVDYNKFGYTPSGKLVELK